MVAGPVAAAGAEDVELEGNEAREVRARGGRVRAAARGGVCGGGGRGREGGGEHGEEVGALGRGLVEEAQARECGEAKVPQLARASGG